MKQIYLLIILIFSFGLSNAQSEQLEGVWVLDSIFDYDILLENPENPISIDFSSDSNSVTIESFCGNTYESFYTPSTTENSIDISQTSWDFNGCSEDNQGWEVAIGNILANLNVDPLTLTYNITQDGDTTLLELSFFNIIDGIPEGPIGYFSTQTITSESLLGEWFVHYINIDGSQQYTTVQNSNNSISFEDTSYNGSVCDNGYGGNYTINDDNTITITNFGAFAGFCNYPIEIDLFLHPYLFDFLNYFVFNPEYSYTISGSGADETLTLTSGNNDFVVYGRSQLIGSELLGEWFLTQIKVDDVIHINYYTNESLFELEFIESSGNDGSFDFIGIGACDSFGGISTPSESNLTFTEFNFTLIGPCPYTPGVVFEDKYFSIFESQSTPFDFSYEVNSGYFEQSLTITDSTTGDEAIYGRTPYTEVLELARTWYLSRIEIPGNPTIQIPSTESPSLTLTNEINPITFRTTAFGEGECNAFMSDYEVVLDNGNNIKLFDFSPTLGFCTSNYEDEYFITIGDPTNNFSEFEIINDGNGSTLILTDLLGGRLVFGDEPLSILENDLNTSHISLKNNPVASEINLSISQSESNLNYQIYSIEGKLVKDAVLNSDAINVDHLNSGLYFIRFTNEEHHVQTIKFIKQ